MTRQIIELYQEEIRLLDQYYSSESLTGYLDEVASLDREIKMITGSNSLIDQKLLSSLVKWRESVIRRIHRCLFGDISKEKDHLRACINELENIRLGAVI